MAEPRVLHVGDWTEHPLYHDITWQCADNCPHPSHTPARQEAA